MIIADCISNFTTSYGLPFSLFLAGLVGGFTHCAGMCAPFVLGQVQHEGSQSLERMRGNMLVPYHLGRMFTYVSLAVLFSSVLNLAFLFSDMRALITAPLLMLAGLLFLVSAFPALGRIFPWVVGIRITKSFGFVFRYAGDLMMARSVFKKFLLGVLLGLMPCGLVISAVMASATAASPTHAAVAMGAFAVGTMPALILLGVGGSVLGTRYPQLSKRFSQGAMTVSAVWLFALAGMLVF